MIIPGNGSLSTSARAQRVNHVHRPFEDRNIRLDEPYGPEDGFARTLDRHGAANSLPGVMIEIRNDMISEEEREALAEELAGWVQAATASLNEGRAQW